MAFQPVPETAQCNFKFDGVVGGLLEGSKAMFSLYVESDGVAWTATTLDLLSDYCLDWYTTGKASGQSCRSLISDAWTCSSITAKDLSVAGGILSDAGAGGAGTRTGTQALPPSVAVWTKFIGVAGGAPLDGGCFLPAGVEGDLDGDDFASVFRDNVNQTLNDWRNDLDNVSAGGALVWRQVIVSRSLSTTDAVKDAREALREAIQATRRATAVTNPVVNGVTRRLIASQRDRRKASA